MACETDYITINPSVPSRSKIYASDLPGVEDLVYELISKDSETVDEVWERIYRNAWSNLNSDVEVILRDKFFVQSKLLSRETSEFLPDQNFNGGQAGVRITFDLPRYARIHVVSVSIFAIEAYLSPGITITIYEDNESGDVLYQTSEPLTEGLNTIFIDQDFEVEKLFISYDSLAIDARESKNKFYNTGYPVWSPISCVFPCFGGEGSVTQINGGGLNAVYDVYCSAEKFVCQNINLFKKALWYKIGQELVIERRYGNRLNQFTTMTVERAEELTGFYQAQYTQALENSLRSHNISEDPICFECKRSVYVKTNLP